MATPTERIEKIVNEIGLGITVNALQQVCFYRAYELRIAGLDAQAELYYDTGMALSKAVKINQ